ncbi:MAG: DUF2961 domain-containing protein [Bacteroidales bacterium]|nr:DUF2961 domain-containing protein [Bacteroidales bacterium]
MKKTGSICTLMALLASGLLTSSCRHDSVVTFRSLLREMAADEILTRYPSHAYRLVQFSSYDRRSIHPDSAGWFANNDYTHFLREETNEGRREFVMLETDGPGAIVRWWMTFGNANALNSYIRVYIDGQPDPVIEGMAPRLLGEGVLAPEPLSSSVSPLTEPQRRGYNLYLPIPFSEGCKITLENDSVSITPKGRTPSIYYNINTRLYEEGTRIESVTGRTIREDSLAVSACASDLFSVNDTGTDEQMIRSAEAICPPGAEISVKVSDNGLAISEFMLSIGADDTASALSGTVIRTYFDGLKTAEVPAGNFFGPGYSYNVYHTRFTSADPDGIMSSSWLMPFRDSCRISILNDTGDTIRLNTRIFLRPYKWTAASMHFGASWKEYRAIETAGSEHTGGTGLHYDLNIADLKGRGLYAGDAVMVFNTVDAWWGEGDEKIYADGESFPSSFGTGTEDYFGYAWCRPELFDHPLIAQPSGAGNFHPGMSVNMRYRILDAIPFKESLRVDLEMWHWLKTTIDFHTTAYYYLTPDFDR